VGRHSELFSNIDLYLSMGTIGPVLGQIEVPFWEPLCTSLSNGKLFISNYLCKWIVFDGILDALNPVVSIFLG